LNARIDRLWVFICVILFGMVLSACQPVSPTSQPVLTVPVASTPTQPEAPSAVPAQTPTETQPVPLAVLLAPAGNDPVLAESLRVALEGPITQAGLRWEMRTELDPQEPGLNLVIALPPDPGISELASQASQVQFVTVGMEDLPPMANLSQVSGENRYDQQGFIAGAIAAMLTPDWRVGAISTGDTPDGLAARNGFLNGAVYFCGLCLAYHGPIFDYPLYVEIPSNASQVDWQAAVDALVSQAVNTVYVYPGVGQADLLKALAQAGMNIISSGTPPEDIKAQWVASITTDPVAPILEHLPDLLAGKGGIDMTAPVVIQEVNPALFSPGRQSLAEKIREDILGEVIDTGVDPLTGETR
jgi:hypothetical protein